MRPIISLQLYTIRDMTQNDMLGALEQVAALGYEGIELAGFGNATQEQIIDKVKELGLVVVGAHEGLEPIQADFDGAVARSKALGNKHVVLGSIKEGLRGSKENWISTAKMLSDLGEKFTEHGLTLSYHNHAFELEEVYDGVSGLELLYANSDPRYLNAELDVYWLQKGGAKPAEFLRRCADRIPTVHIKDMDRQGGFAEVGEGILDWPAIFAAAEEGGAETYIVEQDICPGKSIDSAALSIKNLRGFGKL